MSTMPTGGFKRPYELDYASDDRSIGKFFNVVYSWMAVGLAVTAACAYGVASTPSLMNLYRGGRGIILVIALAAFAISMIVQTQFQRLHQNVATILFLVYAEKLER